MVDLIAMKNYRKRILAFLMGALCFLIILIIFINIKKVTMVDTSTFKVFSYNEILFYETEKIEIDNDLSNRLIELGFLVPEKLEPSVRKYKIIARNTENPIMQKNTNENLISGRDYHMIKKMAFSLQMENFSSEKFKQLDKLIKDFRE